MTAMIENEMINYISFGVGYVTPVIFSVVIFVPLVRVVIFLKLFSPVSFNNGAVNSGDMNDPTPYEKCSAWMNG